MNLPFEIVVRNMSKSPSLLLRWNPLTSRVARRNIPKGMSMSPFKYRMGGKQILLALKSMFLLYNTYDF